MKESLINKVAQIWSDVSSITTVLHVPALAYW